MADVKKEIDERLQPIQENLQSITAQLPLLASKQDLLDYSTLCSSRDNQSNSEFKMLNEKILLLKADIKTLNYKINELRKKKEDDPHSQYFENFRGQIRIDAVNFPYDLK